MLTVAAVLENDRSHIYQAAMMDPLASSMVPFEDIESLVDDLFEAHGDIIPYFR